jgi:hypothetical protein
MQELDPMLTIAGGVIIAGAIGLGFALGWGLVAASDRYSSRWFAAALWGSGGHLGPGGCVLDRLHPYRRAVVERCGPLPAPSLRRGGAFVPGGRR